MGIARLESRPIAGVTLAIAFALLSAAPAAANVGETIIERCELNESVSGYSQSAYRQALHELSADSEEYSDCSSVIREAQRAAAGGKSSGGGTSGGGVAVTATPSEQRSLKRAARVRPEAVKLGGSVIHPGVVHVDVASALSTLPTPLLATLAFLLALLVLVAGGSLRKLVHGRRID